MNRIDEIKERVSAYNKSTGVKRVDAWETLQSNCDEDIEYLLAKLQIAEKALDMLEREHVLEEVDLDKVSRIAEITTGTELMIHEENRRRMQRVNNAKLAAKEALKAIRE